MQIQPYVFFDGRCEEAIAFYREALGAQVLMKLHYRDAPTGGDGGCGDGTGMPPGDKVMHAALQIGGATLLVSDGLCGGDPRFEGVSLSIAADDDAQARRFFDALAAGGQVQQPFGPSFFASSFGMVVDKFGVHWMVVAGVNA